MDTRTDFSSPQLIELPDLEERRAAPEGFPAIESHLELIRSVKVRLSASLGGAMLTVGELTSLKDGSVIKLDRQAGDPVDILLEGKVIARGHLVAVDDNFGVRISELAGSARS